MSKDKLQVPPFRALVAFWAAATHDRLADAAEQIGVTESAVSHQIRQLETLLRAQLFDRSSGRRVLTPTGRRYLERIEPALREIEAATAAILPTDGRQAVRLTLPPSLAATWLIPRLASFEAVAPGVDVQLVLTTRLVDLRRDQVDLAIRHGRGSWEGLEATFLFEDLATPVAAPGFLPPGIGPEALPADLRLIISHSTPGEWEEWARARDLPPPPTDRALMLDSIEQVLQVAEAGHGLAMGRWPYLQARLETGALVAPFGGVGPTGAAYYLCRLAGETPSAGARRLAHWLTDEAGRVAATASAPPAT